MAFYSLDIGPAVHVRNFLYIYSIDAIIELEVISYRTHLDSFPSRMRIIDQLRAAREHAY